MDWGFESRIGLKSGSLRRGWMLGRQHSPVTRKRIVEKIELPYGRQSFVMLYGPSGRGPGLWPRGLKARVDMASFW